MNMDTDQTKGDTSCNICSKPIEHHCNVCQVSLCWSCMTTHMTEKTKRHQIVQFNYRDKGPELPECSSHERKHCEMYCNDCDKPICVFCVTTEHKKHDFTHIEDNLKKIKQQIITDTQELEDTIIPYHQNLHPDLCPTAFDDVISAIQEQEDAVCKAVRDIGSRLKDKVLTQKKEYVEKNEEFQSLLARNKTELQTVVQSNKDILESNSASRILSYRSKNDEYRDGPKRIKSSRPHFTPGQLEHNQLQEIIGLLRTKRNVTSEHNRKPNLLQLQMSSVSIVSIFQSVFGQKQKLWRVVCDETENIWTCGEDNLLYLIDRTGSVLKTIYVPGTVISMLPNVNQELTFSVWWKNTNVYTYGRRGVTRFLELSDWCPSGLCHTINNDLLVSMRSVDETQSRVVKYSGIKETMVIQKDSHGETLFSVNAHNVLLLTENGNKDICVADYDGESVVVVNESGELRFRYQKYFSKEPFRPHNIATDVEQQILIQDYTNNIVHVIDSDGNFLRYIEVPCNGGISIDADHNLAVGDQDTGEIRIIKYLTET